MDTSLMRASLALDAALDRWSRSHGVQRAWAREEVRCAIEGLRRAESMAVKAFWRTMWTTTKAKAVR